MRRRQPVIRQQTADHGPIWSVLGHPEAVEVLGAPGTFSSRTGPLLLGEAWGDTPPAGADQMMAISDPPEHGRLRRPASPFFAQSHLRTIEERIRRLTRAVVARAVEKRDVDFVRDVASLVPAVVVSDLIGVPASDRRDIVALCDTAFLSRRSEDRRSAHQSLVSHLLKLAVERQRRPAVDLCSGLLSGDTGRALLSVEETVLTCENLLVGGVQSVRHTAAKAIDVLVDRPELCALLASGRADLRLATEELLRWTSIALHTVRTTTRDVELVGHHLSAGDRVVVWFPVVNRDERVFTHPDRLDLARTPNRHLALGWGIHYCIGGELSRLELRILLAELFGRVERLERTGPARPHMSWTQTGLDTLPLRLHPHRHRPERNL